VAAGTVLRVAVTLAYRPALIYYDSDAYFDDAHRLLPSVVRPLGYGLFLRVVVGAAGLVAVPVVQHAVGILIAALLYVLLQRLGVARWLSALGAAPALLDGYQLDMEQFALSETLFELLVVGAAVSILWRPRPALAGAAAAGGLLALAALTRSVGAALIVPALLVVLLRAPRSPWPALALLAAFAVPLGAYATWYHAAHGRYALTGATGRFLYARVAPIADCAKLRLSARERRLCPHDPRLSPGQYMWSPASPLHPYRHRPARQNALASRFAHEVVRRQPLAYLRVVAADALRAFAPTGELRGNDGPARWRFAAAFPTYGTKTLGVLRRYGYASGSVDVSLARALARYQRWIFVSGPALAVCTLAAVLGVAGVGRARRSGLRTATLLFAGLGLTLLLASVATNDFTWRYRLPLVVLLPAAAALAVAALVRPRAGDPA
jgi:hypothetical protein